MDKVGIVITLVIVAIAVGFAATGGSIYPTDVAPVLEQSLLEVGQETSEQLQQIKESGNQVMEKVSDTAKQAMDETRELRKTTQELAASKLPARLVSIPEGTSVPGCEKVDLCYDPPSLVIFKGGEVIWKNDDSDVHTVTGGNVLEGPSGVFDSGLIRSDETFAFKFENSGDYQYFCMIHPWANALVIVK